MNSGLIINPTIRATDYVFGGVTSVPNYIVRPNGQWINSLPKREIQHGKYIGSTQDCVSRSFTNLCEIYLKARYNEERNFNDRFLAKISNTSRSGTYFDTVVLKASKFGLLNQELWDIDLDDINTTWEKYYSQPPEELFIEAKKFLDEYEINHDWVAGGIEQTLESLKYSPLQISWLYQGTYQADSEGIIHPKENHSEWNDDHASVLVGYELNKFWHVFDSFDEVLKKISWDYPMRSKKRIIITKKLTQPIMDIKLPEVLSKGTHFVQNTQGDGSFGLLINGKLYIDSIDKLVATYLTRTEGTGLAKEFWDVVEKFNLKNEKI